MRRGFTLIELMIAVMVLGILAAYFIQAYSSVQARAMEATVRANMSAAQIAVEQFATYTDGLYPRSFASSVVNTNPTIIGNNTTVAGINSGFCPIAGTPSDPVLLPVTMRNPVSKVGWAFASFPAAVPSPPAAAPAICVPAAGVAADQGSILYESADLSGAASFGTNARRYVIYGYGVLNVFNTVLQDKQ
jgi:prepilin-type N-terminal cleavage/methylation domain-containing protein